MRPVTLAEFVEEWLPTLPLTLAPTTCRNYESHLRLRVLPRLGHREIIELRRPEIRAALLAMYREDGAGRASIRNAFTALCAALTEAVERQLVADHAGRGAARKIFPRRRAGWGRARALTEGQMVTFLAAARVVAADLALLYELFAGTGMRLGEGLAARDTSLDRLGRRFLVRHQWTTDSELRAPKFGEHRDIDLDADLLDALVDRGRYYRTWLFPGRDRERPVSHSTVEVTMKRVLREAGLPLALSPHGFRHSRAVFLIEQTNGDLRYVKEQLGHRSVAVTSDLYGEGAHTSHRDAVERLGAMRRRPPLGVERADHAATPPSGLRRTPR